MDGQTRTSAASSFISLGCACAQAQQCRATATGKQGSDADAARVLSSSPHGLRAASASGSAGTMAFARSRLVRLLWRPSGAVGPQATGLGAVRLPRRPSGAVGPSDQRADHTAVSPSSVVFYER
jgi:hypothetical protein